MRTVKISKVTTFLIGIIMMMTILVCCSSQVQAAQSGDYTYTITDGKAQITKYVGVGGIVTIPSTIGGVPVTSIGEWAFAGCSGLTDISIPQGVTSIGSGAFSSCAGLTTISIPESVTSIGVNVFYYCTGLMSISIPEGITNISENTFKGCTGLTSITIPQRVTSIGASAFAGCTGLTNISIPKGVTSIDGCAFSGCTGLTDISIPEGVAVIELGTFSGCTGLTDISIPKGVTIIGLGAFSGCAGLTNINIPKGVTIIGPGAFYGCSGLTDISIPEGVDSIGDNTFYGCKGLMSISIPKGVTLIGSYAFYGCSSLNSIVIPEGVTSIHPGAFSGCTGLTAITFNSATTRVDDNADTIPAETTIIGYDPSTAKDYAAKYNRKFEVIAAPITLQSIAITTPATKLIYSIGDKLDITGLVVTGTYSDGSTKAESITAANITGFNSVVIKKDQELTVTVGEKTTTYKVQIVAAPIPPVTGVLLKMISSSEIDLSWDKVNGAKSYNAYQATSANGTYVKVGSVKTTSFKNTKLQPSTSYWYKITAVTPAGESGFSDIKTATTLPVAPSGVKAAAISSAAIALQWNTVIDKTFNVYRSTSQKAGYTKVAGGVTDSSYNDINLTSGTTYWYKVTTLNSDGNESVASTPVSALTKASGPSALKAKVKSKSEINLTWSKVNGAKSYIVYRATSVDGLYSKLGTTKTASFKNTGLQSGQAYWYKVTAVTSAGEGDYSEVITAVTL